MKPIFNQIGPAMPHHAVLRVQPGRLDDAVEFFTKFLGGWRELVEAQVQGDWEKRVLLNTCFRRAVSKFSCQSQLANTLFLWI
jgi:hypothetical protein